MNKFKCVRIRLIDQLRKLKLDEDIELPEIGVFGGQSSGKSSVLEALLGAPFPRSDGMTTKCAIEFCMRRDEQHDFKAVIEVRSTHDDHIRRDLVTVNAQSELQSKLLDFHTAVCKEGVSKDIIRVTVSGKDLLDLTLIDLPGLIQTTTEKINQQMIDDVNEIVQRYMAKSRTIILAVIPCNQDIATTEVLKYASEHDPDCHRTLGVLTKPDLIDEGGEQRIVNILKNTERPLKHGYIMVQNPSQKELDEHILPEVAKQKEIEFFANHSHFQSFAEQTGREALETKLQPLLVQHISNAIGPMLEELEEKHQTYENELHKMGLPPPVISSECRIALHQIQDEYIDVLRKTTSNDGGSDSMTNFMNTVRDEDSKWYRDIRESRPAFDIKYVKVRIRKNSISKSFIFDFPARCFENSDTLKKGDEKVVLYWGYRLCPFQSKPYTFEELKQIVEGKWNDVKLSEDEDDNFLEIGSSTFKTREDAQFRIIEVYYKTDDKLFDEIKQQLNNQRGRRLPGFLNFNVFCYFIRSYLTPWKKFTWMYLQMSLYTHFEDTVIPQCMNMNNILASNTRLQKTIKNVLQPVQQQLRNDLQKEIDAIFERESQPFSINHYFLDTCNKLKIRRFTHALESKLDDNNTYKADEIRTLMDGVVAQTIGNKSNIDQETEMMIDMLNAYWKEMFKSVTRTVGQAVDTNYVNRIHKSCSTALQSSFASLSDTDVLNLFVESFKDKEKRKSLQEKCTRMLNAIKMLNDFQTNPDTRSIDETDSWESSIVNNLN